MVVGEGKFKRIQRKIDIGAVLIAAGRGIALHHLHGILRELTRGVFHAAPVGVSDLGHDLAALFKRFQHERDVELALQRGFHANLNIVEVDKDSDLQVLFHVHLPDIEAFGGHASCHPQLRPATSRTVATMSSRDDPG